MKVEDFVVQWFDPVKGLGRARRPHESQGIRFRVREVLTDGIEDLRPGAWIRAWVDRPGKTDSVGKGFEAQLREIEVYVQPDRDFEEAMASAEGLKRY